MHFFEAFSNQSMMQLIANRNRGDEMKNTRPAELRATDIKSATTGFAGPILNTSSNEFSFMILQNSDTMKLTYPSFKEAKKARQTILGNQNIHEVNKAALFNAIVKAVHGE
jgi:hypothetical protein